MEQLHDGWSGPFGAIAILLRVTEHQQFRWITKIDWTLTPRGSVCSRACIEIETDRDSEGGGGPNSWIYSHEKCSASAWNKFRWIYVVAYPFPLLDPPSPPLIVLQLDTTGHASRLSSSRPTRRRRINTLANKSQRKREGGGIGFAPGKWKMANLPMRALPPWQIARGVGNIAPY